MTTGAQDGESGNTGELRERRLRARLLLGQRVEGDRLRLADAVLRAALDGSRPLTSGERAALQASPLTLRRLRVLAAERAAARPAHAPAANDAAWTGSAGMLRAAADGAHLSVLTTDDGFWRLHFADAADGARVILQLLPDAPFASRLLHGGPPLRVLDGAGAVVLEGRLDTDGECEGAWPFAAAPYAHFQRHGARFLVQPAAQSAGQPGMQPGPQPGPQPGH